MNPGRNAVLVWNVRAQHQAATPGTETPAWDTTRSDYPDGTWDRVTIPGGSLARFAIHVDEPGRWRPGLLYSREKAAVAGPERRFYGNYEALGESVAHPAAF